MDEAIKQIGERLRGMREMMDVSAAEVAALCDMPVDQYLAMEQGEHELSVANLKKIAHHYHISVELLMFGEEPRLSKYVLTRRGEGPSVERREAYKYQSLASRFQGRTADPYIVTVEPKPADVPIEKNAHPGQEFEMILEGQMELVLGDKVLTLSEGDSIYFDSTQPHGMRALGGKRLQFLAIIF